MKLKTNVKTATKHKLSTTLRSWLPILQADLESLKETLDNAAKENPFIEIKSGNEVSLSTKKKGDYNYQKKSVSSEIEALTIHKKSLYDVLHEQIEESLFPTEKSQKIAYEIIENINHNGYFEGDIEKIAKKTSTTPQEVEKVRLRFAYLQPSGVGATDILSLIHI